MKKLLLAASIAAFATAAQAEILSVSLTGDAVLSKSDNPAYGSGTFTSVIDGTYDTETGVMAFGEGAVANTQLVPSAGAELNITGDMNVNFANLTGDSIIDSCSDNINGLGCAGAGYDAIQIEFNPNYVVERRTFQSVELVGAVDLADPQQFQFITTLFDATQGVTVTTTYSAVVAPASTSDIPVPAAVWLFGSALAGLAGLRKRK